MIDSHLHQDGFGILPVLFRIGPLEISSYAFFVLLGLAVGLFVYFFLAKEEKKLSENSFYVLLAGLFGGIIGAKIPIWIYQFPLIINSLPDLTPLLSGRTITGGLIGGMIAVIFVKRKLGIKEKKGNLFAPAIAIGVAIGRIGCFLQGCCFGTATGLPWGVDFGDGILRHPTQIYEALFMLMLFFILIWRRKSARPGQLFFILMNAYFIFRFFEEFIRESPMFLYLTVFQWISLSALLFINGKVIIEKRQKRKR